MGTSECDARYFPRPRFVAAYGGRTWEIVGPEQFAPEGTFSAAGTPLKRYYNIRDIATGQVVRAGAGELRRYCTVANQA